jgi:hypothetical protein
MINADIIQAAMPEHGIDQTTFTASGSLSVSSGLGTTTTTVAHSQGRTFFCKFEFSVDQATWYQEGYPPYLYNATFNLYLPDFNGAMYVDSTNMYMTFSSVGTTRLVYWRVTGYYK